MMGHRLARIGCALAATAIMVSVSADDQVASDQTLKRKHGYLLVHTDVGRNAANWKLNRKVTVYSLPLGENYWLLALRAGNYQWQEINIPSFDLPYRYDISEDKRWGFRIEPGVINYAGTLVVGEQRSRNNVSVRYLNRTAEVLAHVQEHMSAEYAQFGFVYAGYSDDQFLSLINE